MTIELGWILLALASNNIVNKLQLVFHRALIEAGLPYDRRSTV